MTFVLKYYIQSIIYSHDKYNLEVSIVVKIQPKHCNVSFFVREN